MFIQAFKNLIIVNGYYHYESIMDWSLGGWLTVAVVVVVVNHKYLKWKQKSIDDKLL